MMREAIDNYKNMSDRGMIPVKADTMGYPPDLQTLVDGVPSREGANAKYRFLRRIPVDPMTGKPDWGVRSMQDDPDGRGGGGQNVFDVFSKSQTTGLDETPYAEW
jgi:general secretion pathway protein G